jgi:nitroimidazol reductase NimA-like FMN-containing flavoprotein (pyridoxamine 5'-phosphate oxidase superfamily)
VVFGRPRRIDDDSTKITVLHALTEKIQSGRWEEIRPPDDGELARTAILALPLDEASAKVRTGGPKDDPEDYARDVWAGVVPLELTRLEPIRDENEGPAPST